MGDKATFAYHAARMEVRTRSKMLPMSSSHSSKAPPISLAAAKGAQLLFKLCRRRKDIPDPRAFVFSVAYALNNYPEEVICEVTDPNTGLPGTLRYPLEIADVRKAGDAAQFRRDSREFDRYMQGRREADTRAAANADADARLCIVRLIREMGHDGEAVFTRMELRSPKNVRFLLDRYKAGDTIENCLMEVIEDWQKAGSPSGNRDAEGAAT
jgi:hypothetical protein